MQCRKLLAINFWMLFSVGCLANTPLNRAGSEITLQQYINWAQLPEKCVSDENEKKGKIADCEDYESCKKTTDYYAKIASNLRDSAIGLFIGSEEAAKLQLAAGEMSRCVEAYSRMTVMMQPKTE